MAQIANAQTQPRKAHHAKSQDPNAK
ncbi:hypothetical protein CCACVL1_18208 [Corchorus capsularis]|uniref:Uncharacterized protein n=1 Tax=Corchorus capsularis TaxID=210143 RepID=A0A1R3HMF7_COCAP|nr:hypothetical protein CCACVL1_18208 [Corchorus capsularis]